MVWFSSSSSAFLVGAYICCVSIPREVKLFKREGTDGRTDGKYQTYYLPCLAVGKILVCMCLSDVTLGLTL